MLFLDSSTMKLFDKKDEYLGKRKLSLFNCFENIVGNVAFAYCEQMFHFPQCFQQNLLQRFQKAYLWSKGLTIIILKTS